MMGAPKMEASTIKIIVLCTTLLGGGIGASTYLNGLFSKHEERPHVGAVAKDQYQIDQARFERKLDHLGGHLLGDKWVK